MFGRLVFLLSVLGALAPSLASACYVPPAALISHHTALVGQSNTIVLARVTGQSDRMGLSMGELRPLAQFETVEVLRGTVTPSFSLNNGVFVSSGKDDIGDFDGHRNSVFWDKMITRQWNSSDCQMHPVFSAGRTYLLFIDQPHWRAYEEIRSPDDLWLQSVRRLIEGPRLRSGVSMELVDWLALAHGVFVGRIRTCAAPNLLIEEVLHGSFGTEWRYATSGNNGYWPDGDCVMGKRYLVITYEDHPFPLPYYSSSIFPLDDGNVDFRHAIADSEIEILGEPIRDINSLRDAFMARLD